MASHVSAVRRQAAPVSSPWPARGLTLLRIAVGVFLIVKSTTKFGWLLDASPLVGKLTAWAADAERFPLGRSYAHFLLPGAPLFARLALIGELGGGIALIVGFQTRIIALLALLMVLNFHLATGSLFQLDFLSDASGLVVVTALATLALGGRGLPLSVTR